MFSSIIKFNNNIDNDNNNYCLLLLIIIILLLLVLLSKRGSMFISTGRGSGHHGWLAQLWKQKI